MSKLRVFISSVQKELEHERVALASLLTTDPFLMQHCLPVLFEKEPIPAHYDRLKIPEGTVGLITPAVEAQLSKRQKRMVVLLSAGEELTSRRCEQEFDITRPVAAKDFATLVRLGIAEKLGSGRSTRYILKRSNR